MIFCLRVKLRNTQCEQLFSALPRKRACRQWEVHSKSNIMRIASPPYWAVRAMSGLPLLTTGSRTLLIGSFVPESDLN